MSTVSGTHRPVQARHLRVIEFSRAGASRLLGAAWKLNCDPAFIRHLIGEGEQQAGEFLTSLAFEAGWARHDAEAVAGGQEIGGSTASAAEPMTEAAHKPAWCWDADQTIPGPSFR